MNIPRSVRIVALKPGFIKRSRPATSSVFTNSKISVQLSLPDSQKYLRAAFASRRYSYDNEIFRVCRRITV